MKMILALLGGLSLSVATFVGGLVAATLFFSAGEDKKQLADTTDLWTNHPMPVDAARTNLERLPARAVPTAPQVAEAPTSHGSAAGATQEVAMTASEEKSVDGEVAYDVDPTVTGAISPEDAAMVPEGSEQPQLSEAHLDWCSSRYRSYRPRDNSYTPYSGGRRECQSPFSTASQGDVAAAVGDQVSPAPTKEDSYTEDNAEPARLALEQASAQDRASNYGTWEHAQSCFARYRSYRPEDNTYQPLGGGPRRQCQ